MNIWGTIIKLYFLFFPDDISLSELNTSPLLIRPRSGSSKSATPSPAPSNRSRGHSSVSSAEWPPSNEDDIDRLVAIHQSKSGLSTLGVCIKLVVT